MIMPITVMNKLDNIDKLFGQYLLKRSEVLGPRYHVHCFRLEQDACNALFFWHWVAFRIRGPLALLNIVRLLMPNKKQIVGCSRNLTLET